ncbi:MAG: hypothetical protein D3904_12095 [Candidatus Electrothrix sp. EH2]|nr:hypothetical protein [Candidatus Electrothrix sp. EH2]
MLLPREKPFLTGLNSYYLDIEKFIQHLQGEIGSGGLYCKSPDLELLVYFDEYDIVRGVIQNSGEHARVSNQLDHTLIFLQEKNFQVTVYYLDPGSIFFWGQLPAFRRGQNSFSSDKVSLPDLIYRLGRKNFSGFIEVDVQGRADCAVLFLHEGERRGGSYYWGTGGLSPSDADYNTLLGMLQKHSGIYRLGYFTDEPLSPAEEIELQADREKEEKQSDIEDEGEKDLSENESPSELNEALNEFLAVFIHTVKTKKGRTEPLIDLKLKFIDFAEIYPQLDPYNQLCTVEQDGTVSIAQDVSEKEVAEGIVDCAWMVIEENKLQKKFQTNLQIIAHQEVFQTQGIDWQR